jgi:Asp-tRNA(Asn)/Glu-tRNA(Gln) amidotransferase A subunit family amidase
MRSALRVAFLIVVAGTTGFVVGAEQDTPSLTTDDIRGAENIIGLSWTSAERDSMQLDLVENLQSYAKLRGIVIANETPPAIQFNPAPVGARFGPQRSAGVAGRNADRPAERPPVHVPQDLEELAFYTVGDLARLIRGGQVSSTALTQMYLERLKRYGPTLECVITLTEELALAQAKRADEELAAGKYRGPLHGIPYGAKDLFAVTGYPTTWGAEPYRDQVIDRDATVIQRLNEAGAVLVAKLSLGALAWGDVWFGGTTRNPWNVEQGSSGSSAGSAAATAAGLVAFSIGTETWGSIVSPSTRCGVTGLRPTFGRVSRTGAMALSWTMDKVGPICRSVEDCALVLEAIVGPDGLDQTVVDIPFDYDPGIDPRGLRVGFLKSLFESDYPNRASDRRTLDTLRRLDIDLVPIELPDYPVDALSIILMAEAAAAFDDLTRSGRDDLMVRQIRNAWPNVFRSSRFIPAVEYIQANRVRHMIIQEMETLDVDVYVAPSFGGNNLLLTNLTGHPCVVLPNGFDDEGAPVSISFIGRLYGEGGVLAVARAYQEATDYHTRRPPTFR